MDKLIENGKVAVLYSPGFGSGWSTWNSDKFKKQMVFSPYLINLVLSGDRNKLGDETFMANFLETDDYVCVLGAADLEVAWIDKDASFRIVEYDGSESIEVKEDLDWY